MGSSFAFRVEGSLDLTTKWLFLYIGEVHFLGVPGVRALLLGVDVKAPDFGNSQVVNSRFDTKTGPELGAEKHRRLLLGRVLGIHLQLLLAGRSCKNELHCWMCILLAHSTGQAQGSVAYDKSFFYDKSLPSWLGSAPRFRSESLAFERRPA